MLDETLKVFTHTGTLLKNFMKKFPKIFRILLLKNIVPGVYTYFLRLKNAAR